MELPNLSKWQDTIFYFYYKYIKNTMTIIDTENEF